MIGGQHHDIVDPLAVEMLEEVAERAVEREQLDAHLGAAACRSRGRHNRWPRRRWRAGRWPAPRRAASRRASPRPERGCRNRIRARRACAERSSAARAKRPVPTGLARPGTAMARLRDSQISGSGIGSRARDERLGDARVDRGDGARLGDAGMADEGAAAPPPALVRVVAAHHHRRPVLAGDGDDAAPGIGAAHQVAERRHAQVDGRDRVIFGRAAGDALVLGAIDIFVGARGALVEPIVGDDAGPARAGAGEDGRMAGAGLGRGMRLIAGGEGHAVARQAPQAAGEILPIFGEQIGRELIDRDGDDQARRRRRLRRKRARRRERAGRRGASSLTWRRRGGGRARRTRR